MRTLGFRTHILLVLAGAIGAVASLGRPWYAKPPAHLRDESALYGLFDTIQRWARDPSGTTGWDALGVSGQVLAALCLGAAVCAAACLLPGVQAMVRQPLRYGSFAAFGVAVWRLVDSPGPNTELELRLGAFIGLVSATMLWVSAQGVANAPLRRRATPPRYMPPPPPVYEPGR
jgi:hypothetical protein